MTTAMRDDYAEALRLLRRLNPLVDAPPEGAPIAIVAAYLQPTDEYRRLLTLRRLVEDYMNQHGEACVCSLCVRGRTATHRNTRPKTQARLPIDEVPLGGVLFHADGTTERVDEAGIRAALGTLPSVPVAARPERRK